MTMTPDTRPGEERLAGIQQRVANATESRNDEHTLYDGHDCWRCAMSDREWLLECLLAARPTVAPGDDLAALRAVIDRLYPEVETGGHYRSCNAYVFSGGEYPADPCSCGGPELRAALRVAPGDGDGLREAAAAFVSHMDGPEPRHGLYETLKADREAIRAALDPEAGDGR